jgi:pimeloyl-ACP methyl ester carboxylesterase
VTSAPARPVNQIAAGVLDVGYADIGPADGPAVVLLHGWPYDIHMFADVSPRLAAEGYRVIVPYLRGFGTTRFSPTRLSATGSSRFWRQKQPPTPRGRGLARDHDLPTRRRRRRDQDRGGRRHSPGPATVG